MNRRQFLAATAIGAAPLQGSGNTGQTFVAGIVPAGRSTSPGQVESYWSHCEEAASLGFHHIEINNTRAKIAEYYSDRIPEFKEAMARRGLSLAGLALFSRAGERGERQNLIAQHMLLGRFLSAVGGKYVTHMIAIGDVLNEPTDESEYRQIDLETWVDNANEIGRRLWNECGVKLAYHPEQGEVRSGLYQRFLESTDARFVHFLPDTGHIAAGGADSVQVCKIYQSRLACVHLKDFSPLKPRKPGTVSLGEGVVKFAEIIAELRSSHFTGYVMSESGGTNQIMHDYMVRTLNLSI